MAEPVSLPPTTEPKAEYKDNGRLVAVLGEPLKVGYKAGGKDYWAAFDNDNKCWGVSEKPDTKTLQNGLVYAVSDNFMTAFIQQAFELYDKLDKIKAVCSGDMSAADILLHKEFLHHSDLDSEGNKGVQGLRACLQQEKNKISTDAIIAMWEKRPLREAAANAPDSKEYKNKGRLFAIVEPTLMVGYQSGERDGIKAKGEEVSKKYPVYSWFEFNKGQWVVAKKPPKSEDTEYVFASSNEFVTAFIQQAYSATKIEKVEKTFTGEVPFDDVLLYFAKDGDLAPEHVAAIKTCLVQEKDISGGNDALVRAGKIDAKTIIDVLKKHKQSRQSAAADAAERRKWTESAPERHAEEYKEFHDNEKNTMQKEENKHLDKALDRQEKIAMDSTKVSLGTVVAIIGSLVGLSANRRVNQEQDQGQSVSGKSRLFQMAAWGTALAGIVIAAMAIWKKSPTPPR